MAKVLKKCIHRGGKVYPRGRPIVRPVTLKNSCDRQRVKKYQRGTK